MGTHRGNRPTFVALNFLRHLATATKNFACYGPNRVEPIRIDKLRGVQPGTVLNFTGDINLVLGKNGVGKTTLLEVIACAAKLEFSACENEEIDVTVELDDGDGSSIVTGSLVARIRHHRMEKQPSPADVIRRRILPLIAVFIDILLARGPSKFKIAIANNKVVATKDGVEILEFIAKAPACDSAVPRIESRNRCR